MKKIILKPTKSKSNVENNKERTVTDENIKTPYYLVTRPNFSPESPIDGSTLRSMNFLDLLPLPLGIPPSVTVEPSAPRLHELHDHNTKQMTISNYNYQSAAEYHKRLQNLVIGDDVLIRVHPERFLLKTFKRLHTRCRDSYKILKRFGFKAYELDIPRDLRINLVFNIENLTYYRTSTGSQ